MENKKRPYEDLTNITIVVPINHLYEYNENNEFYPEKQTTYKHYGIQGYKGDTLEDLLDKKTLLGMGIDGDYDIMYRYYSGFGKKVILSKNFDVYYVANEYKDKNGSCELVIVPKKPIWYKSILLTEEEIKAARQIIDEVDERLCKRIKK